MEDHLLLSGVPSMPACEVPVIVCATRRAEITYYQWTELSRCSSGQLSLMRSCSSAWTIVWASLHDAPQSTLLPVMLGHAAKAAKQVGHVGVARSYKT